MKVAESTVTFRNHEREVRCCGPPLVQLGGATQRRTYLDTPPGCPAGVGHGQ
jgi:hypothetical protein